jgi:hypothetical protein
VLIYKGSEDGPAIYQAYTHLGGYFVPSENELQGKPFELGPPRPEKELYDHWKSEANEAVTVAMHHQIFGENISKTDPGRNPFEMDEGSNYRKSKSAPGWGLQEAI